MQANESTRAGCAANTSEDAGDSWCVRGGARGRRRSRRASAAMDELVIGLVARLRSRQDPTAGERDCGAGDRWIWRQGAVSLLGCGPAVSAGWEADEKDVKERDPPDEPGAMGLRDSRVSARRERWQSARGSSETIAEFALSLMDHRSLTGDADVYVQARRPGDAEAAGAGAKGIMTRLMELTRERHAKYGDTLFHLEPNIKDCPGGLRDVHVCWMVQLLSAMKGTAARAG